VVSLSRSEKREFRLSVMSQSGHYLLDEGFKILT